ncbi:MAG: cytochrome c oxidase assembly protein [Pseudomonadales bacterium]
MTNDNGRTERKIGNTVARSAVGAVLMFVFAVFVMPPLYDLFCEVTGIGDKTASKYEGAVSAIDESRTVKVQFIATNEATMPWDFEPNIFEVEVHPGEATRITYYAKNRTRRDMVAQAIPNILPTSAVKYFHKTECFCFDQQPLQAGQEAEMPLVFIVDRDLPRAVNTITLSYSIFDVTDMYSDDVAGIN